MFQLLSDFGWVVNLFSVVLLNIVLNALLTLLHELKFRLQEITIYGQAEERERARNAFDL